MKRKLKAALGIKGFLCIASLITIALAFMVYYADVIITPETLFTMGVTSDSWTVYVNDYNETRYLPSDPASAPPGSSPPIDNSTYAFYVSTSADKACAVNITMQTPADNNTFSSFYITVKQWKLGTGWVNVTLYDAATGGSTKDFIRGTNATNDFGYVRQSGIASMYYVICVTYSYDIVDTLSQVTVTFQYTPLPQ